MFCHSLDIGAVINVQKFGRRNRILEALVIEKISLKETDGPALKSGTDLYRDEERERHEDGVSKGPETKSLIHLID